VPHEAAGNVSEEKRKSYCFALLPLSTFLLGIGLISVWHLREPQRERRQLMAELSVLGTNVSVHVADNDALSVYLQSGSLGDTELKAIGRYQRVSRLWLKGADITDDQLKHLAGMVNLKSLSLAKTKVTDRGLRHLRQLNNLERIGLEETGVTDAGLLGLAVLPKLRLVQIRQTRVTKSGVAKLKELSPRVRTWPDYD